MDRATPIPLQPDVAYGPVPSRRFGRSLGVNLLPPGRKLCNFDCVYCQYDATPGGTDATRFPAPEDVWAAVEAALRREACDSITLAGNGEPTLHPDFAWIVAGLARLRATHAPGARLVLLTNGTRLGDPSVQAGLPWLDRAFVKLDAGDDATLAAIDRPRAFSLRRLVEGLAALRGPRLGVQAMFVTGALDNSGPPAVAAWLDLLRALGPVAVHVTTVDRGTTVRGLRPVPAARLEEIAAAARGLGLDAEAFACGDESRFVD